MRTVSANLSEPAFLSVVIPAYNEAGCIAPVLQELRLALGELPCPWEIIVVDDASGDETARLAEAAGVRLLRNPINLGYGHSLLRGIAIARGNLIAISDADGTYPANGIGLLYHWIEKGADHAIGHRTGSNIRSPWMARHVYRWLCGYVVGTRVPDANSGLRVFRRQVVENVRGHLCLGFSFTTSLTLASLMSGHVVAFSDIDYRKRVGKSHVRLRDTLRTAQYLFQLIAAHNPLKLFLPIILLSALLTVSPFVLAALGLWSEGFLAGAVMAAATLILVGLSAHAYLLSRAADMPAPLGYPSSPSSRGEDQPPPQDAS